MRKGSHHSQETREQIAEALRGRAKPTEQVEKIRASNQVARLPVEYQAFYAKLREQGHPHELALTEARQRRAIEARRVARATP